MKVFYPERARHRHPAAPMLNGKVAFDFRAVVSPNHADPLRFAVGKPSRKVRPSVLRQDRPGTLKA
jgi:hypothetical protein